MGAAVAQRTVSTARSPFGEGTAASEREELDAPYELLEGVEMPSLEHEDSARPDLGLTAKQVTAYDPAFTGKYGERLKAVVASAAREAAVDSGLLASGMLAEARRVDYLTGKKVSSFRIGADDYYAKRRDIAAKVPAHAKVRWDTKTGPFTDTNKAGRKVLSIWFMSGRDAALASAVYLKHGEEVLRAAAKRAGGDFDRLPVEVRFMLSRLAFNLGHGGARAELARALNGVDVLIRTPQKKAGPRRKATIRTAQAMHLGQLVFGAAPTPELVDVPDHEAWPGAESLTGHALDGGLERATDHAVHPAFDFPLHLALPTHTHETWSVDPKTNTVVTATKRLTPAICNPGFIDVANDTIVTHTALHDALGKLMNGKYKAQSRRMSLALVDLTGAKLATPQFAGWRSTQNMYGASVPKLLALLALHQLRADLSDLAARPTMLSTRAALVKAASDAWKAAGLDPAPDVDALLRFDQRSGAPVVVHFSDAVEQIGTKPGLRRDALVTHTGINSRASELITLLGFPYIASVAWQTGLRHATRGGLWLTAAYGGKHSKTWSSNPVHEPRPVDRHTVSALSAATFFTLAAQERLVSRAESTSMVDLLGAGCTLKDGFVDGLAELGNVTRSAQKCGLSKGYAHECVLVTRAGRRYVAIALTDRAQISLKRLIKDLDKLIVDNNPPPAP